MSNALGIPMSSWQRRHEISLPDDKALTVHEEGGDLAGPEVILTSWGPRSEEGSRGGVRLLRGQDRHRDALTDEVWRLAERVRQLEGEPNEEGPVCESCRNPADGRSRDEVPLCSTCASGLILEARIAALEEENRKLRAFVQALEDQGEAPDA